MPGDDPQRLRGDLGERRVISCSGQRDPVAQGPGELQLQQVSRQAQAGEQIPERFQRHHGLDHVERDRFRAGCHGTPRYRPP